MEQETAPISVITPTLPERGEFLARCKQSVANQTLQPRTHMVEMDIMRDGPAKLRNYMAHMIKPEPVLPSEYWLAFLDDDDVMMPRHLELLYGARAPGVDVIYSHAGFDGPDVRRVNGPWTPKDMKLRNYVPVTTLVRLSAFRAVGGFPDLPAEDWELWKLLLAKGSKFRRVEETTWTYTTKHSGKRHADNRIRYG